MDRVTLDPDHTTNQVTRTRVVPWSRLWPDGQYLGMSEIKARKTTARLVRSRPPGQTDGRTCRPRVSSPPPPCQRVVRPRGLCCREKSQQAARVCGGLTLRGRGGPPAPSVAGSEKSGRAGRRFLGAC